MLDAQGYLPQGKREAALVLAALVYADSFLVEMDLKLALQWIALLIFLLVVMHLQLAGWMFDLIWGEYIPPKKQDWNGCP